MDLLKKVLFTNCQRLVYTARKCYTRTRTRTHESNIQEKKVMFFFVRFFPHIFPLSFLHASLPQRNDAAKIHTQHRLKSVPLQSKRQSEYFPLRRSFCARTSRGKNADRFPVHMESRKERVTRERGRCIEEKSHC